MRLGQRGVGSVRGLAGSRRLGASRHLGRGPGLGEAGRRRVKAERRRGRYFASSTRRGVRSRLVRSRAEGSFLAARRRVGSGRSGHRPGSVRNGLRPIGQRVRFLTGRRVLRTAQRGTMGGGRSARRGASMLAAIGRSGPLTDRARAERGGLVWERSHSRTGHRVIGGRADLGRTSRLAGRRARLREERVGQERRGRAGRLRSLRMARSRSASRDRGRRPTVRRAPAADLRPTKRRPEGGGSLMAAETMAARAEAGDCDRWAGGCGKEHAGGASGAAVRVFEPGDGGHVPRAGVQGDRLATWTWMTEPACWTCAGARRSCWNRRAMATACCWTEWMCRGGSATRM